MYKKLILTHRKDLLIGDYLIDDRTKNEAAEFQGKHLHIFSDAYPTWDSVLEELIPNKKPD
jgi:5'-nucleotidase